MPPRDDTGDLEPVVLGRKLTTEFGVVLFKGDDDAVAVAAVPANRSQARMPSTRAGWGGDMSCCAGSKG